MISDALKILDAITRLVTGRSESKRRAFEDHVQSIYVDLEKVHKDYLESLNELHQIAIDGSDDQRVITTLRDQKATFEPLRVKIHTYAETANTNNKLPESTREFLDAVVQYFATASGERRATYHGMFSQMLEEFQRPITSEASARSRVVSHIVGSRSAVTAGWILLTSAYAKCRQEMLA